ncbi:MAG: hypothetical protein MUF22_09180 [Chitinispirillaceae bacterium]|nr:hypothetical protein [Chitinispirillaceae bacterium]
MTCPATMRIPAFMSALAAALLSCSPSTSPVIDKYQPPVIFTGLINGVDDTLPGNALWPNRCLLDDDTVILHFYSENFSTKDSAGAKTWSGDWLWINLLPNANDTLIGTRSVFMHLARYQDNNYSYTIRPADTSSTVNSISMHVSELVRSPAGQIAIDRITAAAKLMTDGSSMMTGTALTISQGRITGTIP